MYATVILATMLALGMSGFASWEAGKSKHEGIQVATVQHVTRMAKLILAVVIMWGMAILCGIFLLYSTITGGAS